MRLRLFTLVGLLCLVLVLPLAGPAHADGIIIDPPPCDPRACPTPVPCPFDGPCPVPPAPLFPLAVQSHRVTVTIENQVATTRVDQVFRNDNDFVVEGTYIFPVPLEAAVSDFAMWVNGQKVEGKVLTADEARRIYDDIVRQTRDPALLEYAGRGAVQASVFPIPPGETSRIELEYQQVLRADNGLIHYRYPLNTEKFSTAPLEQVSISVNVVSPEAVRAIYSPSHDIAVARDGERRFSAGYEANDVLPDTDFDLYYSVSPDAIGLNLLTYRDPATGEGFFMLLAAPSLAAEQTQVVARDVIVVLDQSGSMEGEKFAQAQDALVYILEHLNPEDRFNIIAFSTGTRAYTRELQPAANAPEAVRWVRSLRAEGGTNINLALLEALASTDANAERPTLLIFLTDGLATEGVVETEAILANVDQAAPENVRLFAFGVGDDVDTVLLDSLVQQQHGASSYVRPGERIDEAVSGFYARVSTPVLADLQLDFGGVTVEDVYPDPLPDLFAGSQLVVTGRYRDPGTSTITLSGQVNGQPRSFTYSGQVFESAGGSNFIPRLWSTRRIGYLLTQIRLNGENQELIDAIVKLSVRYGIVTPYTSYLVTEAGQDILTEGGREEVVLRAYEAAAATQEPVSGAGAVDQAEGEAQLAYAAAPVEVSAEVVKVVGDRTFLFSDGVWIDTAFDPSHMRATPVTFASDDYFALIGARPELAAAFALGPRVIALAADGTPFESTEAAAPGLDVPPTYTPGAPGHATPAATGTAEAAPVVVAQNATPAPASATATLPPLTGRQPAGLWAAAMVVVVVVAAGAAGAVMMLRRKQAP